MDIKQVIFWEPCLSPHKDALISSFAVRRKGVDVLCCAQEGIPQERLHQGWEDVAQANYEVLIAPSELVIEKIIADRSNETLHIFSGIRHIPIICMALPHVISKDLPYFIMSEPRAFEGIKGCLRLMQSWLFEFRIRRTAKAILAIGANGRSWFKMAGYKDENIFDFAYYLPAPELFPHKSVQAKTQVLYIGQLTDLKGVKYLVEAINALEATCDLTVVGSGPNGEALKSLARRNTDFLGNIKNSLVPSKLAKADILVLPSISKDGWGAVVSEALLQGCAVITTDKVGASIVIGNELIGRVVASNSSAEIEQAIGSLVSSQGLSSAARKYRAEFAKNNLTGDAGACYLWGIVDSQVLHDEAACQFIIYENT